MEKFRTFSIGIRLYRCFKFCAFHASNFDEELAEEEEDEYEAPRNDDDDDDGAKRRKFFVVIIVLRRRSLVSLFVEKMAKKKTAQLIN